ncbi:MAG: type VI secretion system baseplate subunit TssK [Planctomycetota bacterium]|jgi:type VI secretion system protein ImpJ|nr:type VI secretion system baseplate subunit TssK [Planctomycetota bacterium]
MDTLQKVVWTEGMFLSPHHFQQQDRHWESQFLHHMRTVQPLGYGISELRIDEEALALGELVISKAVGVFPDGLAFNMPDVDELPSTRSLDSVFDRKGAAFDAAQGPVTVHLAVPMNRPGVMSCADEGAHDGQPTRFRTSSVVVRDENASGNEKEVVAARKNIRVVLSGEPLENFVSLPIAQLMRDATGNRVILDPEYVPPCLAVGASNRLQTVVRHILEVLNARSSELSSQQRRTGTGLIDLAGTQLANFALLQLINGSVPAIRHLHNQPATHPEKAFVELSRLAGSLCAFAHDTEPKNLPLYIHDDLSTSFNDLERELQGLLDILIPTKCSALALQQVNVNTREGELPAELMRGDVAFYLGLHGAVAADKVIREIPAKMKIASPGAIEFLVSQSLRGVGVQHLSVPPSELPAKPDWIYFQILNVGDPWQEVVEAGRVAFFLPAEFSRLQMDVMAVKG